MTLIASEQVAHAYRHQAERAFDDATFLWLLRSRAADQPHYDRDGLMALDWRLNNLLDVLVTMPQQAWELCARALPTADAGEIFVASASAYRGGNVRRIQEVVEAGLSRESTFVGLVSALAWLPRALAQSWIQRLLRSSSLQHRHLAIAACSWRRESPAADLAELLNSNDCASHDGLYCRTLRLVGELKCFELRPAVERASHDARPDVKFWAHWAAALLGSAAAAHSLHGFVTAENPHRQRAVDLCMRLLPTATARQWISALAKDPAQVRTAIRAIAALGDPVAVDWLLPRMRVPATARLAGEALFTITGIDLMEQKSRLSDELEFTEDRFLPEPDPDAVTSAWQERRDGFVSGQRLLLGKTLDVPHLERVFASGRQRQRRAAAIELALAQPQHHLLNHAVVPEFS